MTDPGRHTRPRSLRTRSTIITFSASSLGSQVRRGPAGALDRPGLDDLSAPPALRRNSSGDAVATCTPWSGRRRKPAVRGGVAGREQLRQPGDVGAGGQRRGQHPAQVGLVDVAGRDAARGSTRPPRRTRPASSELCHAPSGRRASSRGGSGPCGHVGEPRGGQRALVGQRHRPPAAGVQRRPGRRLTSTRPVARPSAEPGRRAGVLGHAPTVPRRGHSLQRRWRGRAAVRSLLKGSSAIEYGGLARAGEAGPGVCGRSAAGSASPCQGEGRGFESRRPLGEVVAIGPCSGGVAERRGNGLQSRVHGFKSRLHLAWTDQHGTGTTHGRLAQSG